MKKIAIFQDDLNIGGIQKSLINLLNYINYENIYIDLYLFDTNSEWIDKVNSNVNIKYLKPFKKIYKYLPFDIALTKASFDFSELTENYDLAIDFNSYQPWTAAAAILVPAEKRIIWVHNDIKIKYEEEWKYRVLFNAMKGKYQFFEAFSFVSEPLIDSFVEMTKVKDKEFHVIPNIIDTNEILNICMADSDVDINSENINVCAVGRLCHQKGYDIMIDYFSKAYKLNNNLRLYIIGGGPDKEKIVSQIDSLGLNDIIFVLGSRENPYAILNRCDAFISTSRYEGQGMNIMEAKALGLQIIIPTHLEKYVDCIQGTDDIVNALVDIEKKEKKFNNLSEYNNKILENISSLC